LHDLGFGRRGVFHPVARWLQAMCFERIEQLDAFVRAPEGASKLVESFAGGRALEYRLNRLVIAHLEE